MLATGPANQIPDRPRITKVGGQTWKVLFWFLCQENAEDLFKWGSYRDFHRKFPTHFTNLDQKHNQTT